MSFFIPSVEISCSQPLAFGDIWASGKELHGGLAGAKMGYQAGILSVDKMMIGSYNNICIRLMQEDDIDHVLELVNSNQDLRWFEWYTSKDENLRQIRESVENFKINKDFYCGIWSKDTLVGLVGLWHVDPWNGHAWLGYFLSRNHFGQGFATIASRIIITYAFEVMSLNRIEIPIAVANMKSRAVAERLGGVIEGVLRKACQIIPSVHELSDFPAEAVEKQGDRYYYDLVMYSILKSDAAYLTKVYIPLAVS